MDDNQVEIYKDYRTVNRSWEILRNTEIKRQRQKQIIKRKELIQNKKGRTYTYNAWTSEIATMKVHSRSNSDLPDQSYGVSSNKTKTPISSKLYVS